MKVKPIADRTWYLAGEVAYAYRVSRPTVGRWAEEGRLPFDLEVHGSQSVRMYPKAEIDQMDKTVQPPPILFRPPAEESEVSRRLPSGPSEIDRLREEIVRYRIAAALDAQSNSILERELIRARSTIRELVRALGAAIDDPSLTVDQVLRSSGQGRQDGA